MTGIGIGRFAKRNASKTTEAALSGAAAKAVADPSRVPDTITLAAATDGTNDGYFPQQEDHHDNDDFCFSNDNNDEIGNDTASSFMDDVSFGNCASSFGNASSTFGGGEGTSVVGRSEEVLLFGDDNESLPQQNDTDANQGESVAASALDTATITNTAINARPKTVFGFSRFAKKNKNPVMADANATTNKISNEETNTESKRIVVTPNHGVRSNVSSIDKTNTIKSHESKGNNSNDSNDNDNGNSNSNSTHNGNHTQSANNKSPPQASNASTSLVATANHPPPVAMELDAASPHFNHEAARANNSRRVSLEESSPSLPERRPFLQPRAAEANQMPQDKSKQQQQQQRENEIKKTNIGGDGRPAFNPDTPSILGQSSRGVGVGNSRTRRISNGAAMQANGNELPLSRQQEKNEERRQLRREEYANVTDNRIMRKNVLSGATAVTPNNSFVVRNVPHKDIGYENQNQNQTEIPTTTTTFGIAPSQEMTTILPETFDRGSGSEMAGRTSISTSTGIDINNSTTTTTSSSTTSLESNQEARFLTTIRETEDLQEKIEVDLLGMNDRFSEHYALLLRDLDVAVDLLDKLEDIEKFANETIANYQHCRPSITS